MSLLGSRVQQNGLHTGPVLLALLFVWTIGACATKPFQHEEPESVDLRGRAELQKSGAIRVSAAVPSAEEAKRIFGIPLYDRGIQPIWLEIENRSSERLRYAPVGTDKNYFAPFEVAYVFRSGFSSEARDSMDAYFYGLAMPRQIPAGATRSGFVFTNASPGTKGFNVDLFGAGGGDHNFTFFIQVPGFLPDHAEVDFDALYPPGEFRAAGLSQARAAITDLPCCTASRDGSGRGAPLNLVFVGPGEELLRALLRAGWYETQRAAAARDIDRSDYYLGRPPDAIFRIQRSGKYDRNELRVWMAPLRIDGEPVWVAQITQYIGRHTELGRVLFDSRLDPAVDEARDYMIQVLWYSQGLEKYAWLDVGDAATVEAPLSDFRGSEYFTDGYQLVLWPSGEPVSLREATDLEWSEAPREWSEASQ